MWVHVRVAEVLQEIVAWYQPEVRSKSSMSQFGTWIICDITSQSCCEKLVRICFYSNGNCWQVLKEIITSDFNVELDSKLLANVSWCYRCPAVERVIFPFQDASLSEQLANGPLFENSATRDTYSCGVLVPPPNYEYEFFSQHLSRFNTPLNELFLTVQPKLEEVFRFQNQPMTHNLDSCSVPRPPLQDPILDTRA